MVNGILNEVPIPSKDGGKLTTFDLMIETNYFEPLEEDPTNIIITPEEIEKIKEISQKKDLEKYFINILAPKIKGFEKIKYALLLQLIGGDKIGKEIRGDTHILLVGDPGAGKSTLLKRLHLIAPKSRYVAGKGASGTGLTAAVVKDEFLGGWTLEAGAMVLANKGMLMIDEVDKMDEEDTNYLHEGMEQQTISVAKANLQSTLNAETSILMAANPKFGRFDPYKLVGEQITLPDTLINRFDLIFPIKDMPSKEKDTELAKHMAGVYLGNILSDEEDKKNILFLKKYVSYAKRIKPTLSEDATDAITDYYVKMRNSGGEEGHIKTIPITSRQLQGLYRLAFASAKLHLREKVTKDDAKQAIDLMHHCLSQIGLDPETGKIDIDRITTGITSSERGNISTIKEIIKHLETIIGKTIPIEEIINEAQKRGLTSERVEKIFALMKTSGDIFNPKPGFVMILS